MYQIYYNIANNNEEKVVAVSSNLELVKSKVEEHNLEVIELDKIDKQWQVEIAKFRLSDEYKNWAKKANEISIKIRELRKNKSPIEEINKLEKEMGRCPEMEWNEPVRKTKFDCDCKLFYKKITTLEELYEK